MNKRDANQGACTNAWRGAAHIHEGAEDAGGAVMRVEGRGTGAGGRNRNKKKAQGPNKIGGGPKINKTPKKKLGV
jgi:hypothetical protein